MSLLFDRSKIMLFIFCLSLSGCGSKQMQEEKLQALPVNTEKIVSQLISDKTRLVGWMDSRRSVNLFPRIDGYIEKIYVTSGQQVGKGQLIIVIDSTRQQATVASTASQVELAAADLAKEKGELKALQSDRNAKKAKLDYEVLQFERYYWLQKKNVVAQAMVDTHDTSRKVAQADVEALDDKIAAQQDVILRAEKRLQATKNQLKEQQTILNYYYIRAPFAGTVGDLPVKEGDYVGPKTELTSVSQTKPLELNVNVPKEYARELHNGLDVELMDAYDKTIAKCPIFYVSPIVDPKSQSLLVKAGYANAEGLFRPSQSIEVRIIFSRQSGLTVPSEAMIFMAGKPFVFVVGKGKNGEQIAEQRPVTLSNVEENRAVVATGLKSGELVITSGVQALYDGAPVKVE